MKTITLGKLSKTEIVLYQDIDETPIDLYNLFNEYMLLDSEIGSTIQDIDKRHINMAKLVNAGKKDEAMQTLNNLYQTFWSALNHINHKSLSFGCLIYSVDGKEVTDHSTDGLTKLLSELSKKGLTMALVKAEVEALKKNFKPNLN